VFSVGGVFVRWGRRGVGGVWRGGVLGGFVFFIGVVFVGGVVGCRGRGGGDLILRWVALIPLIQHLAPEQGVTNAWGSKKRLEGKQ